MFFRGFKITATIQFAFLLVLGMMLVNLVVTVLWQRHIVASGTHQAQRFLAGVAASMGGNCEVAVDSPLQSGDVLDEAVMLSRKNVIFYPGNPGSSEELRHEKKLLETLHLSVVEDKEHHHSTVNPLFLPGVGDNRLHLALPLENCGGYEAVGISVDFEKAFAEIVDKQSIVLTYILVNTIILTTLWFFRMRKLVIEPLESLMTLAGRYEEHRQNIISPPTRRNEFRQLSNTLQNMLERISSDKVTLQGTVDSLERANRQIIEKQNSLVEAEKFAAIGRLSAGLAHEIGNPLSIIQGYLELLGRSDIADNERNEYQTRVEKELERVNRLIQQLLNLARKDSVENSRDKAKVNEVIAALMPLLEQQKSAAGVVFQTDCDSLATEVNCSSEELHQVLLNCLLNAMDAIHEAGQGKGHIKIFCRSEESAATDYLIVEIIDDGAGVSPENLKNVFDPFFTTKEVGKGTGLGLSVSRSIVENCGGKILFHAGNGQGVRVEMFLPVARDESGDGSRR